jgi:hypothetical protein
MLERLNFEGRFLTTCMVESRLINAIRFLCEQN